MNAKIYRALLTSSTAILYADGQQVTAHGVYHLLSFGPIFYVLLQGDDLNTYNSITRMLDACHRARPATEYSRNFYAKRCL
eukprot:scaffold5341_cov125-Skeletonema_dohrnii-CCMP3373.AAC.3